MKNKHRAPAKKNKSALIIVVLLFAVISIAYVITGVHFNSHFFYGTYINNCDVSGMSIEDAKNKLMQSSNEYTLTLEEQNYNYETIYGTDIGLTTNISDSLDSLLTEQNSFAWIFNILGSKEYIADESMIYYTYDEATLLEIIDGLDCVDPAYPIEAKNAELVIMNGEFQIVAEDVSNIAHKEELTEKIKVCIEAQEPTLNLMNENLYDKPDILADDPDLIAKKDLCSSLANVQIDLIFGYADEHIDVQTLINWVSTQKQDNGEYKLVVNKDAISDYVSNLSEQYNTSGKPKMFATTGGDVVEIIWGDYGWRLDNEYAVEQLSKMVTSAKSTTIDLTDHSEESNKWWAQTAVGYDANGNDYYGTTYAEVSIQEQHMWMYQDGVLALETDVVTGNPNLGNDTPVGAFRIRSMSLDAVLRGPGYETPVDYWMVFADDVGFHDATWQAAFGGDLYYTNGSHGCVNMPLDQAEKLYGLIYIGMPVFVY